MGRREVQHIKVGFFIFASLFLAMIFIFMIGSEKKVFQSHYKILATFKDISGLRIGAPVQLAGVSIGFVDNIRFPKDLIKKEIVVTLELSSKYKDRVRKDSVATINTQGLLGDKFIFISIGSPEEPILQEGDNIPTKEVVGLFDLAEKGGDILADFQEVAKHLADFFNSLKNDKGGVKDIVGSLSDIMKQIEKGNGLVHALIYDPKGEDIVKDLAASMQSFRILMGDDSEGDERRARMKSIAKNLSDVAANMNEITTKINQGQGTIGGLINDPSIYNDIRTLFGKANRNSLFKTVVRATIKENDKQALSP